MAQRAKAQRGETTPAYQLIPVSGPSEGVDLRLSQTLLPPGRARSLVNFSLEEPGALVVAPGYLRFSSASGLVASTSRIQGVKRVYLNTAIPTQNSTAFTVAAINGSLFSLSDTGVWSAAASGILSSNMSTAAEIYFPSDRDLVAVMDGVNISQKSTNGTNWTRFGTPRPGSSATLSTLSTGGLSSGEYEINYTYKDRDLAVESNGSSSPSTITLTATSGAINVVIPKSTNVGDDAFVVYARSKTAGETTRRKVSSQAFGGGANSTVVVTSTAWTSNDPEPTDHDVPPILSFGVVWKSRWWAVDASQGNRLRFTQLFQAQSWPALFYIDIPFERGDVIRALQPLGDALVVIGDTKIYLIIGQTSLDFEVRPTLASQDGAFGPRAVTVIENAIVHAGAAGVWSFDGVSDRLLSFDIDPGWRNMVQTSLPADLAKVSCIYHQIRKELRIAVPSRYPSQARGEWILNMIRSVQGQTAWSQSDRDIVGYSLWDGPEAITGNRGRLFSWGSAPIVFEEATGYSANSSAQTCSFEGAGLTLGGYYGRWIDLRGEYEPNGGVFSAEAVIDGVPQGAQTIPIGGGRATYGISTYGTVTYAASGRRQFYVMWPSGAEGRTYVQQFVYSGQSKFRLYTYSPGVVPEAKPRMFTE